MGAVDDQLDDIGEFGRVTLSASGMLEHTLGFDDDKPDAEENADEREYIEVEEDSETVHEEADHDEAPVFGHLGDRHAKLMGVDAFLDCAGGVDAVPKVEHDGQNYHYAGGEEYPQEQIELAEIDD